MRTTLARIASALLVAVPPAGAALYVVRAVRTRLAAKLAWLWPFGGYAALMGAYGLLVGVSVDVAVAVVGAAGLALTALLVVPARREGAVGLALGGVLLLAMIPLQAWTNERGWRAYPDAAVHTVGLLPSGPIQRIVSPEGGPAARLSFVLRDESDHIVSLEIRRSPSWPWLGGDATAGEDRIATVDLDLGDRPGEVHVRRRVALDDDWSRVKLPLTDRATLDDASTLDGSFVIVRLYLPAGTAVLVRGVAASATTPGVAPPTPAVGEWRPTLFHGSRNLLGHSAAVAALAVLAVARSWPGRLLGVAPFLAIAALTGSRSAWLGLLVGAVILAVGRARRPGDSLRSAWWLVPLAAVAGLAGTWAVRSSLLERQTPRLEIFAGAVRAFRDHPWRGLTGRDIGFSDYWQAAANAPAGEVVAHAHNLWLQAAATHGVLGLAAVTWLSLAFMILAWRLGRLAGVALALGALTMSTLDISFLFVGVQLPLIWGLNALDVAQCDVQDGRPRDGPPSPPWQTADRSVG